MDMFPPPLEIIGFHAQQAVEKTFKALLVKQGSGPPKTHDLLHLFFLCSSTYPDLPDFQNICIRLNNYAVEHRYPGLYEVDATTVLEDLHLAETIFSHIKSILSKTE